MSVVYGYRCFACGRKFEREFEMGEAPPDVRCISCLGLAVRQFGVPSVHWKCRGSTKGRVDPFRHKDGGKLKESDSE